MKNVKFKHIYYYAEVNKSNQEGPDKTSKLLHSKGNYKQGEKTTLRMGENNNK